MKVKKVLIVGGGFGGVKTALDLCDHAGFEITLLSDKTSFEYHPTLYHTATGGSRAISEIPLNEILGNKGVNIIAGKAVKLDRDHKFILTQDGEKLGYDILVLSLGAVTNYFGIKGMEEYSYGIKSLAEAEKLKTHLHEQLTDDLHPDLNYIIVGGGPTGVELAGALPGYIKRIMKQHGLSDRRVHVDLVEAAPHLMPRMEPSVSKAFEKRLRKLGVKLYLETPVQAITANTLLINGKDVRSHTVVWTAGIANNPFFEANGFMLAKNHKVQVDKLLQAWPGIFVIADNADSPYSGMAQTALYDAHFVAENLIRHHEGKKPYAYKPKKPVYVTPAGPHWAAVVWGPLHIYGWAGWAIRQAADWIGYKDLAPWWRATKLLLAGSDHEDSCPVCASGNTKG
jgi:NADH:ubiquinone reductase (H+-translocating)